MFTEKKYLIAKKYGKFIHLKFPYCYYHDFFARDNGISYNQIVEFGVLIDGKAFIITCKDRRHAERRAYRQSLPAQYLKARSAQSLYLYGIQKDGD
jgi:hypothetical protein